MCWMLSHAAEVLGCCRRVGAMVSGWHTIMLLFLLKQHATEFEFEVKAKQLKHHFYVRGSTGYSSYSYMGGGVYCMMTKVQVGRTISVGGFYIGIAPGRCAGGDQAT